MEDLGRAFLVLAIFAVIGIVAMLFVLAFGIINLITWTQ